MALRLKDEPTWTKFLTDAGIPDTEAATYATTFVKNRITERNMSELTAQQLDALQISVLGDVNTIMKISRTPQSNTTPSAATSETDTMSYRPPTTAAKLPEITSEMTHAQFRKVETDWNVYKNLTRLPNSQIGSLLYSACDESVQTSLINSKVQFFTLSEKDMLKTIEGIVTKRISNQVHRKHFRRIYQEGDTIQNFLTTIRSAAIDCEFVRPECKLDISRIDIRDQFSFRHQVR